ncbi:MAG: hypothetical protein ACRC6N_11585 [Plesiomonas sp.]|uniref:hypothetical protein n=1 Tax=Plesiomonas sp. TaxID=2486279 RepID=UPI003F2DAA98
MDINASSSGTSSSSQVATSTPTTDSQSSIASTSTASKSQPENILGNASSILVSGDTGKPKSLAEIHNSVISETQRTANKIKKEANRFLGKLGKP